MKIHNLAFLLFALFASLVATTSSENTIMVERKGGGGHGGDSGDDGGDDGGSGTSSGSGDHPHTGYSSDGRSLSVTRVVVVLSVAAVAGLGTELLGF
jgi:hypothetical protein